MLLARLQQLRLLLIQRGAQPHHLRGDPPSFRSALQSSSLAQAFHALVVNNTNLLLLRQHGWTLERVAAHLVLRARGGEVRRGGRAPAPQRVAPDRRCEGGCLRGCACSGGALLRHAVVHIRGRQRNTRCWQHSRHAPSPCCSRAASGSAAGKTSQLVILKYTCLAHGADIHDAYDARRSARHCHSMHRAHLSAGVSPSRCSAWSSTTSRWLRLRGCGSLPDVLMSGAAGEAPLMVRSSALALRPPRLPALGDSRRQPNG